MAQCLKSIQETPVSNKTCYLLSALFEHHDVMSRYIHVGLHCATQ